MKDYFGNLFRIGKINFKKLNITLNKITFIIVMLIIASVIFSDNNKFNEEKIEISKRENITIKTVCTYGEDDLEFAKGQETENHDCYFLKELKGVSNEKEYFLWRCDEGLQLYSFYK